MGNLYIFIRLAVKMLHLNRLFLLIIFSTTTQKFGLCEEVELKEVDKTVEELSKDEKEIANMVADLKKNPKKYEDDLKKILDVDLMPVPGNPVDKFGEVLKEASGDLAAIRDGWKSRNKVKIISGNRLLCNTFLSF